MSIISTTPLPPFPHSHSSTFTFITRPDLQPPRLNITIYNSSALAPGHLFLAPYQNLYQQPSPKASSPPYQIGPVIYDGVTGDLIWSGAPLLNNTNTCDFSAYQTADENSPALSALLCDYTPPPSGARQAVLLTPTYTLSRTLPTTPHHPINAHDLQILDDGRTALHLLDRSIRLADGRTALDNGFREMDLETGTVTFEWWGSDHVDVRESRRAVRTGAGWDWFHANSVDRQAGPGGDFLLSARHTDALYKISRRTGRVVWRLGGTVSDFRFRDGGDFSRQHDARWVPSAGGGGGEGQGETEVLSLLDNAAVDFESEGSAARSSGVLVRLDTRAGTARVVRRFPRPDGGLTRLRGGLQRLGTLGGNWLACWSEGGYVTEFSGDGGVVMEARFEGEEEGWVSYRGYKGVWDGVVPGGEGPVVEVRVGEGGRVVWWGSWNGWVGGGREWWFYSLDEEDQEEGEEVLRCRVVVTGFETGCVGGVVEGGERWVVWARAVDGLGRVVGVSEVHTVHFPPGGGERDEGVAGGRLETWALWGACVVGTCMLAVWWILVRRVWGRGWRTGLS